MLEDTRETSTKIADVIRACVELGASYPDIAGMLQEADAQHNLPGQLAIDALPTGGRIYRRKGSGSAPVGAGGLTPNLYRGSAAPENPDEVESYSDPEEDEEKTPDPVFITAGSSDDGFSIDPPSAPAPESDDETDAEQDEGGLGETFRGLFRGVGSAFGGGGELSEADWGGDVE
ncbi:MAG: hypothetical protein AAF907_05030 [Planctomycetota bacterium]